MNAPDGGGLTDLLPRVAERYDGFQAGACGVQRKGASFRNHSDDERASRTEHNGVR